MKPAPVPGCQWVADRLLVRSRKAAKLALPQNLLRGVRTADVACVVNLVSKAEYLHAGDDAPCGLPATERGGHGHRRVRQPQAFMCYAFWPEPGVLPTARQVRQAIDWIEDAHALGLRVLLNGVGHPTRAALVAGCWRAREGYEGGDQGAGRLDWLSGVPAADNKSGLLFYLSAAEREFVAEWPTGREGQPELADMTWAERDEVFPLASVEHWLRALLTVRVYAGVRGRVRPVDVPVLDGRRVSDGADIDLDVDELRRGTWIGERTLRLPYGWQVVFVSPHR